VEHHQHAMTASGLRLSAEPSAHYLYSPGSALGRHLMGSDEEQVGQSKNAQWQCPAEMTSA
jgi:hypothetical protein